MKKQIMVSLIVICVYQLFAASEQISCTWVATDGLGRMLPTHEEVGDLKKEKYVALFYWTWHGSRHADPGYANTSKITTEYLDAINDYDHPAWKKYLNVQAFHWAEPLFGYYRTTDPWVLRKHAEMLADAGVDVVVFDCTNGTFTWKESYDVLGKTWIQARADGVKTPQITFLCPFGPVENSRIIVQKLYDDIYKPERFKDLWFYWEGKPLIMAYPDNIPEPMKSFFAFRPGQPDYRSGSRRKDDWSWLEVYPQNGYVEYEPGKYEMVSVGVAQNATDRLVPAAMNDTEPVYGRSYTKAKGFDDSLNSVNYGLNFQEQWNRAIKLDPKLVFVTGWNEWVAGRHKSWQGTENAFPDQFNVQYSRDIEPTRAAIGDHYYYQLISNIRRFKGIDLIPQSKVTKPIEIDGDFDDWGGVQPEYQDHKGDTMHRHHRGYGDLVYENETGRNDFVSAKISYDEESLYFYIETTKALTHSADSDWMMLLIVADRDKKTGWQGYDYIVNRNNISSNGGSIERITDDSMKTIETGDVRLRFAEREMELSIPFELLDIKNQSPGDFEFKWVDNVKIGRDMMDFYTEGDVAPSGRFNYVYSVE